MFRSKINGEKKHTTRQNRRQIILVISCEQKLDDNNSNPAAIGGPSIED